MEVGKKNIEWARLSINPITGCNGPCGQRCHFCYAERIANRFGKVWGYPEPDPFIPVFHPERLDQIRSRKKPTIYFFGSMCDWLDDGVEPEWRRECLKVMAENDRHIFITLSKQYKNFWKVAYDSPDGLIPWNVWVGASICYRSQVWGIAELKKVDCSVRFLNFEPLKENMRNTVDFKAIDWVVIGAQSRQIGVRGLPSVPYFRPERSWVQDLVHKVKNTEMASRILEKKDPIPVFLKPNLGDYVGNGWFTEILEQMPDPMEHAPEV